jgi:hypothetical protein
MTILELLSLAAGVPVVALEKLLDAAVAAQPDLAPEVAKIKAALDAMVTPQNIAALATAIPGELVDILHGNLKPTPHAGDAA